MEDKIKKWILILSTIVLSANLYVCVSATDPEPIIDEFSIPVDFDVKIEYLGNNRISIKAEVIPRENMEIEAAVNLSGALKLISGADSWNGALEGGQKGTISLTVEVLRFGRIHEILVEARNTCRECGLGPAGTSRYLIFE